MVVSKHVLELSFAILFLINVVFVSAILSNFVA
jgi:hypothetical protein